MTLQDLNDPTYKDLMELQTKMYEQINQLNDKQNRMVSELKVEIRSAFSEHTTKNCDQREVWMDDIEERLKDIETFIKAAKWTIATSLSAMVVAVISFIFTFI